MLCSIDTFVAVITHKKLAHLLILHVKLFVTTVLSHVKNYPAIIYLSSYLDKYLTVQVSSLVPFQLPCYLDIPLSVCLSTLTYVFCPHSLYSCKELAIQIFISTQLPIMLSRYTSFCLSIYLAIYFMSTQIWPFIELSCNNISTSLSRYTYILVSSYLSYFYSLSNYV